MVLCIPADVFFFFMLIVGLWKGRGEVRVVVGTCTACWLFKILFYVSLSQCTYVVCYDQFSTLSSVCM